MNNSEIVNKVKQDFRFLQKFGYSFTELKINDNNPNLVWTILTATNSEANQIQISFCPYNNILRIDTRILDMVNGRDLALRNYLNFKENTPPGRVEFHVINIDNLESELNSYAKKVDLEFSNDLLNLIKFNDWDKIPYFNPKDNY